MTRDNSEVLHSNHPEPDLPPPASSRHITLTIAAAIVALPVVLTLAGKLHTSVGNTALGAGRLSPTPATTPTPEAKAAAPARGIPGPPVRFVLRWHGTVTITDATDLDTTPPTVNAPQSDVAVGGADGAGLVAGRRAVVTDFGAAVQPTALECANALTATTHRIGPLRTGDSACVVTSKGRIARLRTVGTRHTGSHPRMTFDVTVWGIEDPMHTN
jgi:hypothetical protein